MLAGAASSGGLAAGAALEVRSAVVELRAEVAAVSPRVTLHWNPSAFAVTGITVYRRLPGEAAWGAGVAVSPASLSWADATAAGGVLYEYRVVRTQASSEFPVAEGHLRAGIDVPVVEHRGGLILVVESGVGGGLAPEIHRLNLDLVGDGWEVRRTDVSREAAPAQVRDAIRGWYATDPGKFRAVILLGAVPVPYSGLICPDGHDDDPPLPHHLGAWPTDAYYGDMDGVWTDSSVNYTRSNLPERNHNVPGDGKFDVSLLVGEHLPELAVGRIDLSRMEGVAGGLDEVALLRRYLDRLHAFRRRLAPFEALGERALVDDLVFGPQWRLPASSSGWASGVALFGNAGTAAGAWIPDLQAQDHLVAFGCGPGSFVGAEGVSTSLAFRETRCRAVFNLLFGSFFGDWDTPDNFLRAPLVGRADSHGLVSLWSGHPRWQLFPLAAGGTLADAYRHLVHEVNQPEGPFPPDSAAWTNPDQCHVAIMGDPTLRSHPPRPVTGLATSVSGRQVSLAWNLPGTDGARLGCLVYRSASLFGPYVRVAPMTAPGATGYVDTVPHPGTWHHMVRLVRSQETASAVYENPAQGAFAESVVEEGAFDVWSVGLDDTTEGGDPNRDGVPNLLAYALGAPDGMDEASARLPRGEGSELVLDYSGRDDVLYELLRSLNLSTWHVVARKPVGGSWGLVPGSGYPHQANLSISGGTAKRFRDSTALTRGFWRLRVGR